MQAELDKVARGLRDFYARETWLLENDLGERTLTHRLAVCLEDKFPNWNVDCDYNALGERMLRLPRPTMVSTDDAFGKSIYPDILVHRRAIPENLLAIEIRKASNRQPPDHDQIKLRALTDPHVWFACRIGVFLNLGTREVAACEVYSGGLPDAALSNWFSGQLRDQRLAP